MFVSQQVFILKLYHMPASHAIKIFLILIGQLEKYYQKTVLMESSAIIRKKVFAWMLKLRANGTYNIGYPEEKAVASVAGSGGHVVPSIRFSYYLSIEKNASSGAIASAQMPTQQGTINQQQIPGSVVPESHMTLSTDTSIQIRRNCKIIIECLKSETDWSIVQLLLKELPNILQNKALLCFADMDTLAISIINLVRSSYDISSGISC